jgi:hypothetical protein
MLARLIPNAFNDVARQLALASRLMASCGPLVGALAWSIPSRYLAVVKRPSRNEPQSAFGGVVNKRTEDAVNDHFVALGSCPLCKIACVDPAAADRQVMRIDKKTHWFPLPWDAPQPTSRVPGAGRLLGMAARLAWIRERRNPTLRLKEICGKAEGSHPALH